MNKNILSILPKLALTFLEFVFIAILFYFRILTIGWLFIIFGIFILAWAIIQLGLLKIFIFSTKYSLLDIGLYLAAHFFYLIGWLFQFDGGDSGGTYWVIQRIYSSDALTSFLGSYGDKIFWSATVGSVLCYIVIGIILIVRLILKIRARNTQTQALA